MRRRDLAGLRNKLVAHSLYRLNQAGMAAKLAAQARDVHVNRACICVRGKEGFKQAGTAGYGLRRLMVSRDGSLKCILKPR